MNITGSLQSLHILQYMAHLVAGYNTLLLNSLLVFFLILVLIFVIRKIIQIRSFFKERSVLLEITPPARTEQDAYTTEQLFSLIHALGSQRTWKERLMGYKTRFSLEIVSTKEHGIKYVVQVPKKHANTLKRSLLSYLPHIKIESVGEYLSKSLYNKLNTKIIELKLDKHFAYPLKNQNELEKHDPMAYITGAMTKLTTCELISYQVVLSPVKSKKAVRIKQKILRSDDVIRYINQLGGSDTGLLSLPFTVLSSIVKGIFGTITMLINDTTDAHISYGQSQMRYSAQMYSQGQMRPEKILNSFEQELVSSVQHKVDQSLFDATIRVLVSVKKKRDMYERINGLQSAFGVFSVSGYQSLKRKLVLPLKNIQFFYFKNRLINLVAHDSLLSVSEVSDLYHFPYTTTTRTENIVKIYSKELPAPLSLKKQQNADISFAENNYGGVKTNIGLSEDERRRHMYIIGATGTGKSTLLLSMINQDIQNGKGVCVIDPHGELAEAAITCIPDTRKSDFIYINPDDLKYPIGINLLELTPNLSEEDTLREKEFITESVVSLFRKVFSDMWAANAHRIEYILRNTIYTAFSIENPTLFTLYDLLDDPQFRKRVVAKVTDERLKKFWDNEFGKAGDFQRVKMTSGITARIGRFLFSPSARRILEQEKSTINFDRILDEGKIIICNLSKGRLGEDTSEVFGILILSKIQLAALKRVRIEASKRKDFYVYVDEFQNFATPSFIQMLSEARKYKVNLVMAEQSTSQQKDRNFVNVIIANVGTVISFRSANPDDEKLMLPQFAPYVEKGEIANLPAFRFYIKIAALNPEESFSGKTILLNMANDPQKTKELIELSRTHYATRYVAKKSSQPIKVENDDKTNIEVMNGGVPG